MRQTFRVASCRLIPPLPASSTLETGAEGGVSVSCSKSFAAGACIGTGIDTYRLPSVSRVDRL